MELVEGTDGVCDAEPQKLPTLEAELETMRVIDKELSAFSPAVANRILNWAAHRTSERVRNSIRHDEFGIPSFSEVVHPRGPLRPV